MTTLILHEPRIEDGETEVAFDTDSEELPYREKIVITRFGNGISGNRHDAIYGALAFLLAPHVEKHSMVTVRLPLPNTPELVSYFERVLRELLLDPSEITWDFQGEHAAIAPTYSAGLRPGLLYGGGVESCFALSQLHERSPVLLGIEGKNWMNSDPRLGSLKQDLLSELCEKKDLQMEPIYSNAFYALALGDEYKNRWITGPLFYWNCVPACRHLGLASLLLSAEFEYALIRQKIDRSLTPNSLPAFAHPSGPVFLPICYSLPKIELMERLSQTDFIHYLYSCFKNSDKRWCGECGKCSRISDFCEAIGLERATIGMQEGIPSRHEDTELAKFYRFFLDERRAKNAKANGHDKAGAPIDSGKSFRKLLSKIWRG